MNPQNASQTIHVILGAALIYPAVMEAAKASGKDARLGKYLPFVFLSCAILSFAAVYYYALENLRYFLAIILSCLSLSLASFFADKNDNWGKIYFLLYLFAAFFILMFPKNMAEAHKAEGFAKHILISAPLAAFSLLKLFSYKKQISYKAASILLFITAFQLVFYTENPKAFEKNSVEISSLEIKAKSGKNEKNIDKKSDSDKQKRQDSK
ncbi:MAG: hypothetical protein AB1637_00635 [Elusimicrobiota bacterium]